MRTGGSREYCIATWLFRGSPRVSYESANRYSAMNNKRPNTLALLVKTINRCIARFQNLRWKRHDIRVAYLSAEWIRVRSFIGNNEVACARGKDVSLLKETKKNLFDCDVPRTDRVGHVETPSNLL